MRRVILVLIFMLVGILISAQIHAQSNVVEISKDIRVIRLGDNIWRHVTYFRMKEYGRVAANGLLIVEGECAVLIDTPWTNEQTAQLLDWVKKELGAEPEYVVPTHSHQDCTGGLEEAQERGALIYSLEKTAEICEENNQITAQMTFSDSHAIKCGKIKVELHYHGPGHTVDNIVAWLPDKKILFGGCMVKSAESKTLGFIKEADLEKWPQTVRTLKEKYKDVILIIPGHGDPGGVELLENTLKLLKAHSATASPTGD